MFEKECRIAGTIKKHIKYQFSVTNRRGHFSRDISSQGTESACNTHSQEDGAISKELAANDGSIQSYEVYTDKGQDRVRNGSHIRHSESEPPEPEREQSS